MATKYADLHPYIRAVLGDTDASMYRYADSVLNQHIDLVILVLADLTIVKAVGITPPEFTQDLGANQQGTVVFKAARNIIAPQPDEFSYRTPVLSVVRKGQSRQLLLHIDTIIAELEGGSIYLRSDGELTALTNAVERFDDNLTDAQTDSD
jgi:hypothetical protein